MSEPKPVALVIGDVMLDRRSEGEMARISLEAPAPVIHQQDLSESLGGAGNVACNIRTLGHEVMLMGVIGEDSAGRTIAQVASSMGITACLPKGEGGEHTIIKHRITCGGQIIARIDTEGREMANDAGLIEGLQAALSDPMPQDIKLVVIADYGKGAMTQEVVTALRTLCHERQIPIFVDCRPDAIELYQGVTLLKPNTREAMGMLANNAHPGLGWTGNPGQMCEVACSELKRDTNAQLVVVTNGRYGCCYTDPLDDGRVHGFDAIGPKGQDVVKDICGAGDTTMAALAVGYLEGMDFSASVLFAMHCAGLVVQFHGVHPAVRDEVEEFIYEQAGWTGKLMTDEKVMEFVARKRRLDPQAVIVFTNGCFDGFHAGQLETLRFAARQGSVLVVAYNDDDSLRALKGTDRPHIPDSYRSSHLASQEPVDAVFRFDGDAAKLIRRLKPDVLVKGADAASAPIPGADFMAQHGGRVELCPTDCFYVTVDRQSDFTPPAQDSSETS